MLKLKLVTTPPKVLRHRAPIRLHAPTAHEVVVTGDFCDWDPAGRPLTRATNGDWRTTLLLPPGRYEYRFLVDGAWADDPACPDQVPNPFESANAVLRVEPKPANPNRPPMNQNDLAGYRKSLRALAARLDRNLAHDRRELLRLEDPDLPTGPMPSTEDEPNAGLHEVEVGLIANESTLLTEVTAAIARIDAGTFGRCEMCQKKIARARLGTVPYARHCIRCAKADHRVGDRATRRTLVRPPAVH
jgi:DnaK suppressor protein